MDTGSEPEQRSPSALSISALGFVAASVAVLGGALAGAASPGEAWRLWSVPAIPVTPSIDLVPALAAYYGGLIVLVRAWLLLRRHHLTGGGVSVAGVALIVITWALPLMVGPPLGSRDVYAYAAQGRMAEQGLDVYAAGPSELGPDDPVLATVDPLYHDSPSPYGPVFVSLSSLVSSAAGDRVVAAVLGFRLLAVIGLGAAAVGVHSLARSFGRDPIDALILAVANPLVLFHLISGAHNEAIMLGFLVTGVAVARRQVSWWGWLPVGIALCAFAAAIKLPAILAVAFLGWPWAMEAAGVGRRAGRLALIGAEALAVIALAGRLTGWGWGWVDTLVGSEPVDAYLSVTQVLGSILSLATGIDLDLVVGQARLLGIVVAIGVSGLLLLRRRASWPAALAWSLLLFAVLHPTTQPWYLTWGVMILAATSAGERNRVLVGGCAVAMFVVLPMGPQMGLVVLESTGRATLVVAAILLLSLTFNPGAAAGDRVVRSRRRLDGDLVSVIVPTRHEGPNVGPLVDALAALRTTAGPDRPSLGGRGLEVVFVDDSDDDTPTAIEAAATSAPDGVEVRLLHRTPAERWGGLGGAVVDGAALARGAIVVVMDGDLQHPPATVPRLVATIEAGSGLAVASRRVAGGSESDGLTGARRVLSRLATAMARWSFPSSVGRIADPMSGFFAYRASSVDLDRLQPDGFKILLELAATHRHLRPREVPFDFAGRRQGLSKASLAEAVRYLGHLIDLRIRTSRFWGGAPVPQRAFPSRFRQA